jgi:hypothetical protein
VEFLPDRGHAVPDESGETMSRRADARRLAGEAKTRDAGVLHQRKGPTMSEPSSGGRRAGDLRHQRSQRHRSSNGVVRVSVITLVARTMHAS